MEHTQNYIEPANMMPNTVKAEATNGKGGLTSQNSQPGMKTASQGQHNTTQGPETYDIAMDEFQVIDSKGGKQSFLQSPSHNVSSSRDQTVRLTQH